jgi:hypothetical protein
MGNAQLNSIPDRHTPTALQARIIELLNINSVDWMFEDTAGGCNALSVTDAGGLRQVVCTNIDDVPHCIFIVDALDGGDECAMFATDQEIWGKARDISDDPYDFLNIALWLTDADSDPYEHHLADGSWVADLFNIDDRG